MKNRFFSSFVLALAVLSIITKWSVPLTSTNEAVNLTSLKLPPYDDTFLCQINRRRIPSPSKSTISAKLSLLLLSGDIASNPGPEISNCTICHHSFDRRSKPISCTVCIEKTHAKCTGLRQCDLWAIRHQGRPYHCSDACLTRDGYDINLLPGFDLSFNKPPTVQVIDSVDPKPPPLGSLLIGFANINSLRGKYNELCGLLQSYDYAAFCLNETKLGPNIVDNFDIPGYDLFRRDRNANGGGVAIYCKKKLLPRRIRDVPDIELISIQIRVKRGSVIISTVYRPPNQSLAQEEHFSDQMTNFLADLSTQRDHTYVVGDFNWDALNVAQAEKFQPFCHPFGLSQLVDQPTHGNSALDLLFTPRTVVWGLGCPIENDKRRPHHEIWFHVTATPNMPPKGKRPVWLYSKADWPSLNQFLFDLDLPSTVLNATSMENAWINWKSAFLAAVTQYVPKKSVPWSRLDKGWFNPQLKRLFKERDLAYRRWKRDGNPTTFSHLKQFRSKLRKAVANAKKNYYCDQFAACAGDQSKFWKTLNKMCGRSKVNGMPDLENTSGHLVTSNVAKANLLADQYDKVFSRFDGPCPPMSDIPINAEWLCDDAWVYEQIRSLDTSKASGPDGISPKMLLETSGTIAPSVALLINRSLIEGKMPSEWKLAIVVPVQKVKNSQNPADYRPVSLLCIISKLCERCVIRQLAPMIDDKLPSLQYGFRSSRSTEDALALLEHHTLTMFNQCNGLTKVVGVFFDLSKAFDKVPHGRLLTTLEHVYHIPPGVITWLKSYLSDRQQQVRVGDCLSSKRSVISGVPQGSILGPVLFNAYSSPVQQLPFSDAVITIGYADDLVYLKKVTSVSEQEDTVIDINAISTCYKSLGMSLNISKTKYMLFTLADTPVDLQIKPTLAGTLLEQVHTYKYLGVWLDRKLAWSEHCSATTLKCKRAIGAFSRSCRRYVPQNVFIKLYRQTIQPSLLYCIPVVWPIYEKDKRKYESVNKYATKIATNNFQLDYDILLHDLRWKSINRIVKDRRLCLFYKYHNGQRFLPANVIHKRTDERATRATSSLSHQYVIPVYNRARCNQSFFHHSIQLWNTLPDNVIDLELDNFNRAVKRQ